MLVIRLSRTGRKKYSTYRIVAADSRRPVSGKPVGVLGHYNPHTKELKLEKERIEEYLNKGARPSNSLIRLLEKEKVALPSWAKYHAKNKPSKQEAKAEPAAETKPKAAEGAPAAEEEPSADSTEGTATEAAKQAADTADKAANPETGESPTDEQRQAEAAENTEKVAAQAALEAAEEAKAAPKKE